MTKEKPKFTHIRIAKTGEVITYLEEGFELFEDKDPLWKQPEEQFSHIAIQEGEPITVEVDDNLLKNTNILSKEIEDRVNYETTHRFELPKFHFKRPE